MAALPSFTFDTADFAEEHRYDAVADLWRNYLTFKFDRAPKDRFFLRSTVRWLNDCTFVHSHAAPMSCRRPPPPDEEALISISYLRRGRQNYVADGELRWQTADAVHVCRHSDQTVRHCLTDSEILILYVPAIRLGLFPYQDFPGRMFPVSTPLGALLRSILLDLSETLAKCTHEEAQTVADSVCAFLEPVLRNPADTEVTSIADFRRAAIRRYIEENIKDNALDAEALCHAFGVSRPTLYRLFKEDGGVMAYIAQRRTHRIFCELSRSTPRWGLIRTVAETYGFYDMTQFTRTFRKYVGMAPGSIVGLAIPNGETSQTGGDLPALRPEFLPQPLVFSQSAPVEGMGQTAN